MFFNNNDTKPKVENITEHLNVIHIIKSYISINPTIRGAFKARPEQKLHFWQLFVIQMTQKI